MHRPDPDREGRSTLSRLDKGQVRHTLLPIPVFSSFFLLDRESVWHLQELLHFPPAVTTPLCVVSPPVSHSPWPVVRGRKQKPAWGAQTGNPPWASVCWAGFPAGILCPRPPHPALPSPTAGLTPLQTPLPFKKHIGKKCLTHVIVVM